MARSLLVGCVKSPGCFIEIDETFIHVLPLSSFLEMERFASLISNASGGFQKLEMDYKVQKVLLDSLI